jgi:hypothetical protein
MTNEEDQYIKYKFPDVEEPLTLRHKTDFYSVSPNYWDSSGMKMSIDPKIIYGTIPNTTIHTVLKGSSFFVEDSRFNDLEVNTFIGATLNKYPTSKTDKYNSVIQRGESETVEFKATFKWDINENRANRELPEEVTQAICAFSNSRGGTVFIGVMDDKSIYGLKKDIKKIFKDIDIFQQEVPKKIRDDLGGGINYKMEIEEIQNEHICVIEVEMSDVPVFFQNKEYYVRRGTSNHNCNAKETFEHIRNHYEIYHESFLEEEEENNREMNVDIEFIKNYIEMLENDEIPSSRIYEAYNAIRRQCISISHQFEFNETILRSFTDISTFFCSRLNKVDDYILNIILESLRENAEKPETLQIIKETCFKNLVDLYENGERNHHLIFILFVCGYYSDIIKTISNAIDNKDLRLINEFAYLLKPSRIKTDRIKLLKLLNRKIDEFDSQEDKELIKITEKLIKRLERS